MTSARLNPVKTPSLAAVFGSGRSGSSWLGAIINSHPEVAYRFEPFHRLANRRIAEAERLASSPDLSDSDLNAIYAALLPANPLLEKPPFFEKRNSALAGKVVAWNLARTAPRLQGWFEKLYTPKGRPLLVFKEVTMEPLMENLLERTTMPIIYLVRHPGAVVASHLRGQAGGAMPVGDHRAVRRIVEALDRELAETFASRLAAMTETELNALIWRAEVQRGLRAVRAHASTAMLVLYKHLVTDTIATVTRIFEHFGLELHPQTRAFLETSTRGDQVARWRSGEGVVGDYFSVFRNVQEEMNKWMSQLGPEEVRQVRDIVEPSEAYQHCAALGDWRW
jgi:hypothetical protein